MQEQSHEKATFFSWLGGKRQREKKDAVDNGLERRVGATGQTVVSGWVVVRLIKVSGQVSVLRNRDCR